MRARFTFISLLLLVVLAVGYFLSFMAGFLTLEPKRSPSWLPGRSETTAQGGPSVSGTASTGIDASAVTRPSSGVVLIEDTMPGARPNTATVRLVSSTSN